MHAKGWAVYPYFVFKCVCHFLRIIICLIQANTNQELKNTWDEKDSKLSCEESSHPLLSSSERCSSYQQLQLIIKDNLSKVKQNIRYFNCGVYATHYLIILVWRESKANHFYRSFFIISVF